MGASLIVAASFMGLAGLIQQRTKRKAALWLSALFALVGGMAFAGSEWSSKVHGALGGLWSWLPGVVGCVLATVIIIDLTDLKPNWPAVGCMFFMPTFVGAAADAFTSSGLPAAVTLGVIAGIIQHRAGSKSTTAGSAPANRRGRGNTQASNSGGSKRGKMLKWLSIPIALVGGIAFAVSSVANDLDGQIDKIHFNGSEYLRGAIGLFIVAIAIIDVVDGKPDKPAAICTYALPMFFVPACALIGVGFGMI